MVRFESALKAPKKFASTSSDRLSTVLSEQVTALFSRYTDTPVISIKDLSKGCDQKVYLIDTGHDSYVLKQSIENNSKISNEAIGCEHAKALNIPAPTVLYQGEDNLIETAIPGKDLQEISDVPNDVYVELSQHLKRLHTLKMNFYGEIGGEKHSTLRENICAYHDASLESLLQTKLFTAGEGQRVRHYFKQHEHHLSSKSAVLLHGDIADDNVMTDGNKITGILDWGDLTAGVPEEEFACAYADMMDKNHYAAMVDGYGGIDQEKVDYFTLIRLTWILDGVERGEMTRKDAKYTRRVDLYRHIVGLNKATLSLQMYRSDQVAHPRDVAEDETCETLEKTEVSP